MNKIIKHLLICCCALTTTLSISAESSVTIVNDRVRKQLLDDNWAFSLVQDDKGNTLDESYSIIDLPHDWSILNDFNYEASMGNDGGYLPAGKGIYKKTLNIKNQDYRHILYLEGAYMNAHVFVNDSLAGHRPYGYSSVMYDITPYLKEGDNDITIKVDNTQQVNARWYTGSGIYRHVWLLNLPETAVEPWSLYITTPRVETGNTTVNAKFEVTGPVNGVNAVATIYDKNGKEIYNQPVKFNGRNAEVTFNKAALLLWSPETPNLYAMNITLKNKEGNTIDSVTESFGARSISYSAANGFILNGSPALITGACVHSDNSLLGARSYDAAEKRKVKMLKEAGFNAVRTSHNHPSPAFLDECDRQGLLVIDEAFDGWRDEKKPFDYSKHIDRWWQKDLESLVKRDRNHPSIICWSIGNEVIERKKIEVVKTAKNMANLCRELDPTRPVTSALCAWDPEWDIYDPLAAQLDITGYNYMIHMSESDHQRVPERIMWQTESYPRDAFENWVRVNDNPYIIGDFVWTGIDYLGEAGIGKFYYTGENDTEFFVSGQWPMHASFCGDIDLIGVRKPISHYREILYGNTPSIYLAVREPEGYFGNIRESMWGTYPTWENWNWEGFEGEPIEVEVISTYPAVRLYLDNDIVGDMPTNRDTKFKAIFKVPYKKGTLKAMALDNNGNEIAESNCVKSADNPYSIRLTIDKNALSANNQDLVYVTAEIVDRYGNFVPLADNEITFKVSGNGTLEATGSADIKDCSGYLHPTRKAWKGRAAAIVKSTDKAGKIVIEATSPRLKKAIVKLKSE